MPTTQHTTNPYTITFDGSAFAGADRTIALDADRRVHQALADRLSGMTWREVADRNGYRSAGAAEHNVGRFVAWMNGQTATRRNGYRSTPGMSMRRYGVEIEFQGCTMAAAAAAIRDVGITCETGGYHASRTWNEWRVEYDSSVSTRRGTGGEAVSPILSGPEGLEQVKTVVQAIRSAGGRVSVSCGIHVHLDASDLTGEQIARLMCAYDDRTEAFDTFVSPSRRSTSYNRTHYVGRMTTAEKERVKEGLIRSRENGIAHANRYRNVNVTSLHRSGTVEFRQHQGSLNGTKIVSWVQTLLALSAAVVATQDEDLPFDAADMIASLQAFGLSAAAARHMAGRIA